MIKIRYKNIEYYKTDNHWCLKIEEYDNVYKQLPEELEDLLEKMYQRHKKIKKNK